MSPIIGIDSDAVVITWPLILQGNSVCEIRLYNLVIAVTGQGTLRPRNPLSIPEKGQKSSFPCNVQTDSENHTVFYLMDIGGLLQNIKPFRREALHSPLSSAKDNNKSSQAPSPLHSVTCLHAVARN